MTLCSTALNQVSTKGAFALLWSNLSQQSLRIRQWAFSNMVGGQQSLDVQVKILRDEVKGVPGSGGRSRGSAFVEFTEHQHALVALRVLNNNPGVCSSLP